ncbi:hypothetical protein ABID65_007647 [Bradyrhizobium sp. S3.9.2]|uniref:hypothetical protein n=1 Tax=unclassified Bradyrhizobium TaxID=2631580 RepID=UPI003394BC83
MTVTPTPTPTPTPNEVDALVEEIKKLLRGQGPEFQGAAPCDLVSMYFAGHHPALREEVIEHWIKTMRALIPPNEEALFAHYGKPEGWEKQ